MVMITTATSLGRSGLQDWIIQRVSAIILAAYTVFLVIYFIGHPHPSFASWHALFSTTFMRYASLLALIALLSHAWVGIWTVTTDYLKPTWVRLVVQVALFLWMFSNLVWGIQILWKGM